PGHGGRPAHRQAHRPRRPEVDPAAGGPGGADPAREREPVARPAGRDGGHVLPAVRSRLPRGLLLGYDAGVPGTSEPRRRGARMSAPLRLAVPLTLTTFRLLLAPTIVIMAHAGVTGPVFAVLMVAAFLSDLFDGILARRLGVVTAALRRYDVV